jgi:hypothetical protein
MKLLKKMCRNPGPSIDKIITSASRWEFQDWTSIILGVYILFLYENFTLSSAINFSLSKFSWKEALEFRFIFN